MPSLLWIALILCLLLLCTSFTLSTSARLRSDRKAIQTLISMQKPKSLHVQSFPTGIDVRGGSSDLIETSASRILNAISSTPSNMFNTALITLSSAALMWKWLDNRGFKISTETAKETKPKQIISLQQKFLAVFWLLRLADWMQGPYFFEVYHSKVFGGAGASLELVSKIFLTGFAVTGVFGPFVGRLIDKYGRKKGVLAFVILYTLSAFCTRSNQLWVIVLGRIASGVGTSLLFSAPEAWLVSEHESHQVDGKWLAETFGLAYAGDSIVAIAAGQLAGKAAHLFGPTGPFTLSVVFLAIGGLIALLSWGENTAMKKVSFTSSSSEFTSNIAPAAMEVFVEMWADKKILLLGAVQALFEASMYVFVLHWPPLIKSAVQSHFGTQNVPYGSIFSCLMASCLIGSTAFSALQKRKFCTENSASYMLVIAATALGYLTTKIETLATSPSNILPLSLACFIFEACVGMYFPTIGTLRSKYLPDKHRAVMMNLFGIPLNVMVISVVLAAKHLGSRGALQLASAAVTISAVCMRLLKNYDKNDASNSTIIVQYQQ